MLLTEQLTERYKRLDNLPQTLYNGLEQFFKVRVVGSHLKLGQDPELKKQILTQADYPSFEQVNQLN